MANCGKKFGNFGLCILETGHVGECTPACRKDIKGRYNRSSPHGCTFQNRCVLSKNHDGKCVDYMWFESFHNGSFTIFETPSKLLISYSEENVITAFRPILLG